VFGPRQILDLETMEFSPGPRLATPRAFAAASRLDDARLIVVGGADGAGARCGRCYATTEVLDIASLTFAPGPTLRARRAGCALARVEVGGPRDGVA
jgi:hypothetical protein